MRAPTIALLLLATSLSAAARVQPQVPASPAKITGFRAETIADLDDVQEKIMDLASSVPAEKYAWRPAPGVRSIGEVFMHIAGGNYFLATFVGAQPPSDIPKDLEKVTDKAQVVAELKKSFDHVRRVVANQTDADLEKSVNLFGKTTTYRYVFTTLLNHLHEHLGQSIAYARMNNVVPPWSR